MSSSQSTSVLSSVTLVMYWGLFPGGYLMTCSRLRSPLLNVSAGDACRLRHRQVTRQRVSADMCPWDGTWGSILKRKKHRLWQKTLIQSEREFCLCHKKTKKLLTSTKNWLYLSSLWLRSKIGSKFVPFMVFWQLMHANWNRHWHRTQWRSWLCVPGLEQAPSPGLQKCQRVLCRPLFPEESHKQGNCLSLRALFVKTTGCFPVCVPGKRKRKSWKLTHCLVDLHYWLTCELNNSHSNTSFLLWGKCQKPSRPSITPWCSNSQCSSTVKTFHPCTFVLR